VAFGSTQSFFLSTEYYAKDQAEIARGNLRKVWKTHPFCHSALKPPMVFSHSTEKGRGRPRAEPAVSGANTDSSREKSIAVWSEATEKWSRRSDLNR
jgi:hypothetical protein